jgi:adenosine deaminase
MLSLDGVIEQLTKIYPNFSFGMVFVGFKMWKEDYSEEMFEMACRTNWKRLVGFDYVQEEDKYESLASYDPIIDRVLKRYPHLAHLKKAYHAGETSNHLTDNIEIAVKAGTVRIGHGINILQRS